MEETNEKTANQGITAISVRGFKSLAEHTEIEIRPLTILAGANSSGKSSVMQPLLMLKQTIEAPYDPGPLLLNGPNVRFTSADQFLSKVGEQSHVKDFTVGLTFSRNELVVSKFAARPRHGIVLTETYYHYDNHGLAIHPKMSNEEFHKNYNSLDGLFMKNMPANHSNSILEILDISRYRCFLVIHLRKRAGVFVSLSTIDPSISPTATLRSMLHVPGLRGNPERSYPTTAVGPAFPGVFENYVASIINQWQASKDPRLESLTVALEVLGLTGAINARRLDDTQVEVRVGRLPYRTKGRTQDLVNIADVGFGVSQTLPVLVALLTAEPGQLVYLEQPELHLHPRAQVAMAQLLVDAAQRGVRVVAETHSSLLLLAIQTKVAKGEVDPSIVKLHWFQRNDDGVTTVSSADLDESGAFGDWPEDFADVTLAAESAYLDAAEARAFGR